MVNESLVFFLRWCDWNSWKASPSFCGSGGVNSVRVGGRGLPHAPFREKRSDWTRSLSASPASSSRRNHKGSWVLGTWQENADLCAERVKKRRRGSCWLELLGLSRRRTLCLHGNIRTSCQRGTLLKVWQKLLKVNDQFDLWTFPVLSSFPHTVALMWSRRRRSWWRGAKNMSLSCIGYL